LIKHPTPNGFPKYGYLLEHDGRLVGAILLIFTRLQIGQETTLRCHVTNWYVKPNYRAYAALFFIKALGHKDVNYLNISALPAAQPILDIQGFSKYSRGQFFALPETEQRIKVLAGRVTLMRRHWSYSACVLGSFLYAMLPLSRVLVFGVMGSVTRNSVYRQKATMWKDVWRHRQRWINGWNDAGVRAARDVPRS